MPTLTEYVARWDRAYNRPPWVSARTAQVRRQILASQVLPRFGALAIDQISVRDVSEWQQMLLGRGVSVGYARVVASAFAAPLAAALREGLVERVVVYGLTWPRRVWRRPDPYTPAEIRRLMAYFRARKPHYLPLVGLVAYAGMRPSEACGLAWSDVDLDHGVVQIERAAVNRVIGEPKTDRSRRRIRLPQAVLEILRDVRPTSESELVVTAEDGRPIASAAFSYHWKVGCEAVGVRYRGFYRARSAFLTRAVARGANLVHVSEYSGTSVDMLAKHYVRWLGTYDVPGEPAAWRKRGPHRATPTGISPILPKAKRVNR